MIIYLAWSLSCLCYLIFCHLHFALQCAQQLANVCDSFLTPYQCLLINMPLSKIGGEDWEWGPSESFIPHTLLVQICKKSSTCLCKQPKISIARGRNCSTRRWSQIIPPLLCWGCLWCCKTPFSIVEGDGSQSLGQTTTCNFPSHNRATLEAAEQTHIQML